MSRIIVQSFQKSINESAYSHEQIALIWDFYVTKSLAASASQKRTPIDYGLKRLPWKEMCLAAHLSKESVLILPANTINKSLEDMDLIIECGKGDNKAYRPIEIEKPRIVCCTPYSIADEEPPKARVGDAESVLTHIRNALAHGNTYFFDNSFLLLEDKDQHRNITARMVLSQKTLIDWVAIVDYQRRYYNIVQSTD